MRKHTMTNMRKAVPVFSKILVRLVPSDAKREEVSAGGIIIELNNERDLELKKQGMCYGHVVDMGPYVGCRRGVEERVIPCKKGDKILFYKHAGTLLEDLGDGNIYRILEDLDIEAVFPEEGIEL